MSSHPLLSTEAWTRLTNEKSANRCGSCHPALH